MLALSRAVFHFQLTDRNRYLPTPYLELRKVTLLLVRYYKPVFLVGSFQYRDFGKLGIADNDLPVVIQRNTGFSRVRRFHENKFIFPNFIKNTLEPPGVSIE
jgi:hypothetical protein